MNHSFDDLFELFDEQVDKEETYFETKAEKKRKSERRPTLWIMFTWHIVTTEGLLDALCAFIATRSNARSCTLLVSNVMHKGQETEDGAFYKGLKKVAVALGNLPMLKCIKIDQVWNCNDLDDFCEWGDVDIPRYYNGPRIEDGTPVPERNFRYDAIVLSHVCQITEYADGPSLDIYDVLLHNVYVEEFTEALQRCPLLETVHLDKRLNHEAIEKALLLLPSLTELNVGRSILFKTVGEFVAKDSMRRLCLKGCVEITTKEWSELCSALGSKSTKLTFFHISFSNWKLDDFWPLLSRALSTNESLTGLSLRCISYNQMKRAIPSAVHGPAFVQALVNHPRLSELHVLIILEDQPNVYHFWQDVFCNGVAQMTSLRQLRLKHFMVNNTLIQNALRQIIPCLYGLTIEDIFSVKEWHMLADCMINSRHLITLDVGRKMFETNRETEKVAQMMEGIVAMNIAGRAYVVDNTGSESKLLGVLGSVRNNLDCLFIHLRESPVVVTQSTTQAGAGAKLLQVGQS